MSTIERDLYLRLKDDLPPIDGRRIFSPKILRKIRLETAVNMNLLMQIVKKTNDSTPLKAVKHPSKEDTKLLVKITHICKPFWTKEEDTLLCNLVHLGYTWNQIVTKLDLPEETVYRRYFELHSQKK